MNIYPLATTQCDWSTFIKVVQDTLGYSPTRGLDGSSINPKTISAYLACLDMENKPMEHLENIASTFYRHVHMSFICVLDEYIVMKLIKYTDLKINIKEGKRKKIVTIITADIGLWRETINNFYKVYKDEEIEELLETCKQFLIQGGYKNVFTS